MRVSKSDWDNYIAKLRALNDTAASKIEEYIQKHGLGDTKTLIDYSYAIVNKYGEASAALAAQMYDAIAEMEGKVIDPAEMADIATYGDVAKAINGTMKTSTDPEEIASAASRWVKMAGADTTYQNAIRDGAEFAWIPSGDETCAFCIMLAANGWQRMSKKALKNGHAEHIHSNCDCQFAIRFSSNDGVAGYDPNKYKQIYEQAEGRTYKDKLNSIRREQYAEDHGEKPKEWQSEKLNEMMGNKYNAFNELVNNAANKPLYEKYSEEPTYRLVKRDGSFYRASQDLVCFGWENHEGMSEYSVISHEVGHMFDHKMGRVSGLHYSEVDAINENCKFGTGTRLTLVPRASNSDEFLSALRADMEDLRPKVADKSIRTELLSSTVARNASAGIQDALDGFFGTQDSSLLPWGHGARYYNREYNNRFKSFGLERGLQGVYQSLGFDASSLAKTKHLSRVYEAASEAWANMSSAVTCGGEELRYMQQYMPRTYNAYIGIVEVANG